MTREEAKAAGKKFFEGKPCKDCGSAKRYVSGGTCVQCARETLANYSKLPKSVRLAPVAVPVSTGRCRHGRQLHDYCRKCEVSWHTRRRFGPVTYNDIHVGPQA